MAFEMGKATLQVQQDSVVTTKSDNKPPSPLLPSCVELVAALALQKGRTTAWDAAADSKPLFPSPPTAESTQDNTGLPEAAGFICMPPSGQTKDYITGLVCVPSLLQTKNTKQGHDVPACFVSRFF